MKLNLEMSTRPQTTGDSKSSCFARPANQWLAIVENGGLDVRAASERIYGVGHPKVHGSRSQLAAMLRSYLDRFGDGAVVLARAPGRINVMGRHVDHQGGHVNMMALDRDTWMVAGKRSDRSVHLHDLVSDKFPDRAFSLGDLLEGFGTGGWRDFVDSHAVTRRAADAAGDWSQYVRGSLARLQAEFPDRPLPGMNLVASGDLPVAAGLSSSSSLIVANMEAACALNAITLPPLKFVELCGEAEWYVGTRGGAGDHAAIKLAQFGKVMPIGFFPMEVGEPAEFPPDYALVVCNSGISARKTEGARDQFNHRVACYLIGRELLKLGYPQFATHITHLSDVNSRNLEVPEETIVEMISSLPESISEADACRLITEEVADQAFSTHTAEVGDYPVRSVVLFGLSECERSRGCAELLKSGRIEELGRWMSVSHNGDRVSGQRELSSCGALVELSGAYGCSIPEIDRMVDIALSVDGVLGAQISGAGLGGCMMVLAHREACAALERAMTEQYYVPAGREPDVLFCTPVSGSGVLAI